MLKPIDHVALIRSLIMIALAVVLIPVYVLSDFLSAESDNEMRRLRAGTELFPSILAADLDIKDKAGDDKKLHLLIVYEEEGELAEEVAKHIKNVDSIKEIPLQVVPVKVSQIRSYTQRVAGVFLSEKLTDKLQDVINYSCENKVIIFSPFNGDVERGVLSGIFISSRILPFINSTMMTNCGIQLKEFFLKVAKTYEK